MLHKGSEPLLTTLTGETLVHHFTQDHHHHNHPNCVLKTSSVQITNLLLQPASYVYLLLSFRFISVRTLKNYFQEVKYVYLFSHQFYCRKSICHSFKKIQMIMFAKTDFQVNISNSQLQYHAIRLDLIMCLNLAYMSFQS